MAGLDTLLSLAGSSGGSSTGGAKYIAPSVPINVAPIGLNLGEIFNPSNLGTTGTVPLYNNLAPTQAAGAQAGLLAGMGSNNVIVIAIALAALLLLKRRS